MTNNNKLSLKRCAAQSLLGEDRYLALREAACRYRDARATLVIAIADNPASS
jgi:hypothetical protein